MTDPDRRAWRLPGLDRPVTLVRRGNVVDDDRGYVLDEVSAEIGGVRIGHIKTENLPLPAFRRLCPTIFNYMTEIGGVGGCLPYGMRGIHYHDLTHEQLVTLVCRTQLTHIPGSPSDYETMARNDLLAFAAAIEARHLAGRQGEAFARFRSFHVDRPFVAYVEVDEPLRRRGIGTLLYAEAADWLRERGLALRSSGLQTVEAKAAWRSFADARLVRRDRHGRFVLRPAAGQEMRAKVRARAL